MFLALIHAAIISSLSIFAFFGGALFGSFSKEPKMFDLMFGLNGFSSFTGMTALLILEIVLIIVSIATIVLSIVLPASKKKQNIILFSVLSMVALNITNAALSFSTLALTNTAGTDYVIGIGPIAYASLQIMSIFILVIVILALVSSKKQKETVKPIHGLNEQYNNQEIQSQTMSEQEKLNLVREYKKLLDEGTITQEEFDKKKEQLLK